LTFIIGLCFGLAYDISIGQPAAEKFGYDKGYQIGRSVGFATGNETGYNKGYEIGYDTGHGIGHAEGYNVGYGIGYDEGYDRGYVIGNGTGYSTGYGTGNKTGYNTGYQIGYENGNRSGYDSGYKAGLDARGYSIGDPNYAEAIHFVATNQVDKNRYVEDIYTCVNFAADFINAAFSVGYRCGYVYIQFTSGIGHSIVCFSTTDRGMLFIEPQNDDVMPLTVGQHYWDRAKYPTPSYDDTVLRYAIVW